MQKLLSKTLGVGLQLQATSAAAAAAASQRGFSKATTGIVGLPVDEEAREHLGEKLNEILEAIKVIPESAEYRRTVEATVKAKLEGVVSDLPDSALEAQFGRQLEQEIRLCKDELSLIPKMAEWKPWDAPPGHTVEIIEEKDIEAAAAK